MNKISKVFLYAIGTLLGIIFIVFLINFFKIDLYMDENKTIPISNNTVLTEVYVNGTKCIAMESYNHGALSCYWGKTYKDNY